MHQFSNGFEQKGLFTFYREQAEYDEKMKQLKKKKKMKKMEKIQEESKKEQEVQKEEVKQKVTKKSPVIFIRSPQIVKKIKQQSPYFIGKKKDGFSLATFNQQQKITTKRLDQNIVIHFSQQNQETKTEQIDIKYKRQYRKRPSAFISTIMRKSSDKGTKNDRSMQTEKKSQSGNHSIIMLGSYQEQKRSESQIQRLPDIKRSLRSSSELLSPKKWKSRKVQAALRSGNKDLIRFVRQSLKEQSFPEKKDNVAYINYLGSYHQKQESNKMETRLNQHQKRLINILSTRKV